MSETNNDIRVLNVSRRMGASPKRGWEYAITFIRENEPGEEMMWLDEFLDQYADNVKVGEDD